MSTKRRIAVNLLHVAPGDVGGSEEYSVEVLRALAEKGSEEIEAVLHASETFFLEYPDLLKSFECRTYKLNVKNRFKRILAESTFLRQRTREAEAVHHFGGRLPLFTATPAAVTIHDLQPLDMPENFSVFKRTYFKNVLPSSIKRADLVVTVSGTVTAQISERFEIPKERLMTVSVGVRSVRTEPSKFEKPPIILYPASTYPHKNHLILIEAFIHLSKTNPDARLVFIGAPGKAESQVKDAIEKSGIKERISLMGRVAYEKKKEIFESAAIVAFPSKYEGFGIPVLEAMSEGIPAVVAEGTPAAELLGGRGMTVNPEDAEGWSIAFSKLLSDTNLRNTLVSEGFKQAEEYTYEKSAQQLLETWRQLIKTRHK